MCVRLSLFSAAKMCVQAVAVSPLLSLALQMKAPARNYALKCACVRMQVCSPRCCVCVFARWLALFHLKESERRLCEASLYNVAQSSV
jgi:hypothetical protein